MTNEEFERAMNFVLEQQAQFAEQQAQFAGRQTQFEAQIAQLAAAQDTTAKQLGILADAVLGAVALSGKLAESQLAADRRLSELEQRLDAFIVIVEKYITRNNGNGRAGAQ